MPGIAGIIHQTDRHYLLHCTENMSKALVHNAPDICESHVFGGSAFCQARFPHSSSNFAMLDDRSVMLLFSGHVYDDGKLRKAILELGNEEADNYTQPQLFLAACISLGRNILCGMNGTYVIVIWDSEQQELTIINDRYGFRKFYYSHFSKKFAFATSVKPISSDPDFKKELDEKAMSQLLVFGHLLDDRTLFKNIKLLPPASVLTYKGEELSLEKYWEYSFHSDDDSIYVEDDYVDGLSAVTEAAIRKRVSGLKKIAVPLSGGLDSRVIVGMVKKIGFQGEVITYSYGHKNCYDVIYGRKIAKQVNYPHYFVSINGDYIKKHAREFMKVTDGMISCLNAHMGVSKSFLSNRGHYNIATGFLGDIATGVFTISKKIVGLKSADEVVRALFEEFADIMTEEELEFYLREDVYQLVCGVNYDTFRSSYFRCPTKNKFFITRYGNLIQRQRRYTSFNLYWHEDYTTTVAPFTDNDFVDFNLHTPAALLLNQNVYKKMIVKHLPRVAKVPYNVTQRPLKDSWLRAGFRWRWESFLKNQLPLVTFGRMGNRLNDNYIRSGEAIRTGSKDFVLDRISGSPFIKEYFAYHRIKSLLDDHMADKVHEYGKICALLTLSLWAEEFL